MPRNTKTGASAKSRRASAGTARGSAKSSRSRSSSRSSATSTSSRSAAGRPRSSRSGSGRTPSPALPFHRWWLLPTTIGLGIALFAWGYYPVAAVQYRQARERAQLAAELKTLQARNARLRAQVERLKTPEGVEDYARSQLGLVKQGEHAVRVVDGDEAAEMSATAAVPRIDSDESRRAPVGAWTAFLDLVFGFE